MSGNKDFLSQLLHSGFFKKMSGAQLSLSDSPGQHELKIQIGHPEAAVAQGRGTQQEGAQASGNSP